MGLCICVHNQQFVMQSVFFQFKPRSSQMRFVSLFSLVLNGSAFPLLRPLCEHDAWRPWQTAKISGEQIKLIIKVFICTAKCRRQRTHTYTRIFCNSIARSTTLHIVGPASSVSRVISLKNYTVMLTAPLLRCICGCQCDVRLERSVHFASSQTKCTQQQNSKLLRCTDFGPV